MRNLVLILTILISQVSLAKTLTIKPDRTIQIKGVITHEISEQSNELIKLSKKSSDPIYLFINSPGGYVQPGLHFIDAMNIVKENDVKIICVSTVMSASMAFFIYANCDERYALPNTNLLWHPMKVAGLLALSKTDMYYLAHQLDEIETPMNEKLIDILDIKDKTFELHYKQETMWIASILKKYTDDFLNIIHDLKGIKEPLSTKKKTRATFFRVIQQRYNKANIIWISEEK